MRNEKTLTKLMADLEAAAAQHGLKAEKDGQPGQITALVVLHSTGGFAGRVLCVFGQGYETRVGAARHALATRRFTKAESVVLAVLHDMAERAEAKELEKAEAKKERAAREAMMTALVHHTFGAAVEGLDGFGKGDWDTVRLMGDGFQPVSLKMADMPGQFVALRVELPLEKMQELVDLLRS